jgi:dihydroxyacetone kinase-like protein
MDGRDLKNAFSLAASRFEQAEARLNALDGAIGDGDHGITVRIGFAAIQAAVTAAENPAPAALLRSAGRAFMNVTGGAIGVIFGKALMSAGAAVEDCESVGAAEFVRMLRAMESAVSAVGRAKPGDKTILDSIYAAAEVGVQGTLADTLRAACEAAGKAAEDTASIPCRVGRASRLGERSIGHPDPGAVSFGIFLRALLDSLEAADSASDIGIQAART